MLFHKQQECNEFRVVVTPILQDLEHMKTCGFTYQVGSSRHELKGEKTRERAYAMLQGDLEFICWIGTTFAILLATQVRVGVNYC